MALTVLIRSGDGAAPAAITFDAPRVVIGRGDGCEVLLPDPSVSHRHASIRQRGTDYVVIDEGSTNGTFVGPVRLSPQAPRVLRPNDLIRVGRIWLEVRVEQAAPTVNPQATTREIALALVANALSAQGEPLAARVRVTAGKDLGREFLVSDFERTYVIGRAPEVDFPLTDGDASRRHVEVFRSGQHVAVRDLGSKNGSELGGKQLDAGKETIWAAGAMLRICGTELVLEDPLLAALEELEAGADEPMRENESIDPPRGATEPGGETEARVMPEPRGAGPLADAPRQELAPPAREKSGLKVADLIVALLALVVLGLSLLGLAWVLRSD